VSQYNTINSQIDELSNNQDLKQQQQELLQHQLQEFVTCHIKGSTHFGLILSVTHKCGIAAMTQYQI
jgi:DNA repair ATPase RecN